MADLEQELYEAEVKAWQSLASYKFMMFGYWAAIWVHLNRIGEFNRPDPFKPLVQLAQEMRGLEAKRIKDLFLK